MNQLITAAHSSALAVEHFSAADNRPQHDDVLNALGMDGQQIRVEDDEVNDLAERDAAACHLVERE